MFGKDLSVDGMLMHSAEFCLPSPCYCPAAFAEQEGRQLLRWQDQPEQMLRRCSNDDSKGISHIPCKFQKKFWGNRKADSGAAPHLLARFYRCNVTRQRVGGLGSMKGADQHDPRIFDRDHAACGLDIGVCQLTRHADRFAACQDFAHAPASA